MPSSITRRVDGFACSIVAPVPNAGVEGVVVRCWGRTALNLQEEESVTHYASICFLQSLEQDTTPELLPHASILTQLRKELAHIVMHDSDRVSHMASHQALPLLSLFFVKCSERCTTSLQVRRQPYVNSFGKNLTNSSSGQRQNLRTSAI